MNKFRLLALGMAFAGLLVMQSHCDIIEDALQGDKKSAGHCMFEVANFTEPISGDPVSFNICADVNKKVGNLDETQASTYLEDLDCAVIDGVVGAVSTGGDIESGDCSDITNVVGICNDEVSGVSTEDLYVNVFFMATSPDAADAVLTLIDAVASSLLCVTGEYDADATSESDAL